MIWPLSPFKGLNTAMLAPTHTLQVMVRGRTDDQDTLLDYIDKYKPPPQGRVPTPEPPPPCKPETPDPIDKYRLHCWVMVMKGAREVLGSFFLEPTTGN